MRSKNLIVVATGTPKQLASKDYEDLVVLYGMEIKSCGHQHENWNIMDETDELVVYHNHHTKELDIMWLEEFKGFEYYED